MLTLAREAAALTQSALAHQAGISQGLISKYEHGLEEPPDEIVRRLVESVPPGLRAVQQDLESNFRAVLRASLTKLDLVSRDEFDAQTRVLERTRARLEELERKVAGLEGAAAGAPPTEPGPH